MATVNLSQPYTKFDSNPWAGNINATSSKVTISDGYHKEIFSGSFSYNDWGDIVGGTMRSYAYYQGSATFVSISGFAVSSATAYSYYMSGNGAGLMALMLSQADTINGSAYSDRFSGYAGNDTLYGNAGDDLLYGNDGNDVLNGGAGIDTLDGGTGNDTYYIDNIGDKVIESSVSGGIDTVISTVSTTLGNNLETLSLSGTAAINGIGNSLANTLNGNSANNILNGMAGADTMAGGLGNDTYHVDNLGDVVIEAANAGTDTVKSAVTYTLGNTLENLTLTGTENIDGKGNDLANILAGNNANNTLKGRAGNDVLNGKAGDDILVGGGGKDTLTGGEGSDTFDFNALSETGLTSTNWDVINDFVGGVDRIDLSDLDANIATADNDAFSEIIDSASAFSAAGQLKLVDGVLYGNTDADADAEFAIQLVGVSSVSLADFVA